MALLARKGEGEWEGGKRDRGGRRTGGGRGGRPRVGGERKGVGGEIWTT